MASGTVVNFDDEEEVEGSNIHFQLAGRKMQHIQGTATHQL